MRLLSALLLSALPLCAAADNSQGFYVGGGANAISFDENPDLTLDMGDGNIRVFELLGGYKYNSALGVEVRVGTNIAERNSTETVNVGGTEQTIQREAKIRHYSSIYYRPELANEEAKLYGLLGYSQMERSVATWGGANSGEQTDTESGFSYGFGVGFVMNPDFNLNFEFRRLIDKQDQEIEAAGINIDYRF